ncbi:MAG TPA: asparaginase domain-containing protein, partial [Myxococcaceae bacterium]|nr:asparaginase domain-containing protein [Myxococcaceae bacterium]
MRSHCTAVGIRLALLGCLLLSASHAAAEEKAEEGKARIRILATGGTIAGVQTRQQDSDYKAGVLGVEQLIAAVPNLKQLASLGGEQVANI